MNMMTRIPTLNRRGISLVEILIGIMVLGIGVISLATLFPIGLVKMKRAVTEVRGTVVARSALSETRVRNLLAPPFGPPATYFSGYPAPWTTTVPTIGQGLPVIIDPLWMIQAQPASYTDRFGFADFNADGTADFPTGQGLLRVRGGPTGAVFANELELMSEVFSSPDDLAYGDNEARVLPLQGVNAGGPPYLSPTNGTPFAPRVPGLPQERSLSRERRYTWLIVARKVNARQGMPGRDGMPGVAGVDDDGANGIDDIGELGWTGSDDTADFGPDSLTGTADDPARDMLTALPGPAPVGPFDVTIIAFYTRDFASREAVFANESPNTTTNPPVIFTQGSEVATLRKRTDNVPFPEIPLNSYVMDTTLDLRPVVPPGTGFRNGYVYRVISKSVDAVTGNLTLILDQKARADGYVVTVLKGAVGVYEKQVP